MKQWLLFFLFLFLTGTAAAQTTLVSGTITDSGGQTWNLGTYTFTFYPSPANPTGPYFQNGVKFNINTTISGNLSAGGTLTNVPVPDNLTITPSGSLWIVKVCPASTSVCYQTNLTITSPTQNISATVVPPAIQVFVNAPPIGYAAYSDSEIQGARQGTFYTNLIDNTVHFCNTVPPCVWISGTTATTAINLVGPGTVTGNYTHSGTETFNGNVIATAGQNIFTSYNLSGVRISDNNKLTSVSGIQTDCGSSSCPFLLTPLFVPSSVFSPLPANDYLAQLATPSGKYGPMMILGDLPPSTGTPTGYPSQATGCGGSTCDTGLDLGFTNFSAARYYNLTGTTVSTNYAPHFEFYYFTGNPTAGGGGKQFVSYYNAVETSRTSGDLANVSDMKLGNNYLALRAPSFAGTMEGIENDVFYRAAGTIGNIGYATLNICGIFDNIAANISSTSSCNPTGWDNNGSGAVGQAVISDARLTMQMTGGGTQGGVVGYCAFCSQSIGNGGTVTQNISGFNRVGPGALPTFSASKYWLASINQPGVATGANVNNDWWQGGDWNSGHLTFGGDGGATAVHVWMSSGTLRVKTNSPTSTGDGQALVNTGISVAGMQHLRVPGCATGAALGNTCDTSLTWPTSFVDANYTVVCNGSGVTSGTPEIIGVNVSGGQTAAAASVRTVNNSAAAAQFTQINCIALHD